MRNKKKEKCWKKKNEKNLGKDAMRPQKNKKRTLKTKRWPNWSHLTSKKIFESLNGCGNISLNTTIIISTIIVLALLPQHCLLLVNADSNFETGFNGTSISHNINGISDNFFF